MLRFRGRTMQLMVGRRGLDPRWMGLPPSTSHWSAVHKAIKSKKAPPAGSSRPPPALWGGSPALPASSSSTGAPPHDGFLHLSSPSKGVPLPPPSPPANPARSLVETASCSRPFSPSCPSTPYEGVVPHSPSAGVLVPSPGPGVPLLSTQASHAGRIVVVGTDKWLWPPSALCPSTVPPPPMAAGSSRTWPWPALWGGSPGAGLPASCLSTGPTPHGSFRRLPSPSDDVPLPSPSANPAHSRVGKANCSQPSLASSPYGVPRSPSAGVVVPSPRPGVSLLSAPASQARNIEGHSALCPSTPPGAGLMLLTPGAGVPLPSPPQSHGRGDVGTDKGCQPPKTQSQPGLMPLATGAAVFLLSPRESLARGSVGMDKCLQPPPPSALGSDLNLGSWPRRSGLLHLKTVVSKIDCQFGNRRWRGFSSVGEPFEMVFLKPVSLDAPPRIIRYNKLQEKRKLKMFEPNFIKKRHLLENVDRDMEQIGCELFDLEKLKKMYCDVVKDMVVANGLHISDQVDETYVRDLIERLLTSLDKPYLKCITSLDLMKALVALATWKWPYLIAYLRDQKIMVLERWDLSLCSIETLIYNHGWKVPLQGQTLYKGQTDASFIKRLASLCSIIWDENDQVKDCCVCVDVECKSNVEAELFSMYLLERRGIDLGIKNLLAITDNDHVYKTLKEEILPRCKLEKTLVGLKSKYETFLCHRETREQLFFPDSLAKCTTEYLRKVQFENMIRGWPPLLLGHPLFRVHQTEAANKKFLGTIKNGGKLTLHQVYKVKVNDDSEKIDAIENILKSVCPEFASVRLNDEEKAHSVEKELITLYPEEVAFRKNKDGNGYVVELNIRQAYDQKILRIICDPSIEAVDDGSTINVRLMLKNEEDYPSIPYLAPECYLFFNGEDRLELGENVIKPKPKDETKTKTK